MTSKKLNAWVVKIKKSISDILKSWRQNFNSSTGEDDKIDIVVSKVEKLKKNKTGLNKETTINWIKTFDWSKNKTATKNKK